MSQSPSYHDSTQPDWDWPATVRSQLDPARRTVIDPAAVRRPGTPRPGTSGAGSSQKKKTPLKERVRKDIYLWNKQGHKKMRGNRHQPYPSEMLIETRTAKQHHNEKYGDVYVQDMVSRAPSLTVESQLKLCFRFSRGRSFGGDASGRSR